LADRNNKDIYKSSDTLLGSTTNVSPLGSTVSSSCTSVGPMNKPETPKSSTSTGNVKGLEKQTSREELIKRQQKNAVHVNSPLATNLVNSTIAETYVMLYIFNLRYIV